MRRVVITGTGIVSSLGMGTDFFWEAVKNGKSGISRVTRFDTERIPTKIAAEIKNFKPEEYLEKKEIKRLDRFSQYALIAAEMAIEKSKINLLTLSNYKTGVIVGSGFGGLSTTEKEYANILLKGKNKINPFSIPMTLVNMPAVNIAIKYKIRGFNECVVTACATSANAIGDAVRLIRHGYNDVMIAGGAEATITPSAFIGFCSMKAMSVNKNPDIACRPFDAERDGFVMGEGACILVLEELEHAIERGADIIAEIVGYACNNDAYDIVIPSPNGEGAAQCMKFAIDDAGIKNEDISYINAHGTSTKYNDICETDAIKTVFGEHTQKLAVSSTKSMTGHLIGAAGAVETMITAMSLKEGFIPPTINYNNPDPECDLDYVPNKGRRMEMEYALSNSFGFGGHNAVLVLKKF